MNIVTSIKAFIHRFKKDDSLSQPVVEEHSSESDVDVKVLKQELEDAQLRIDKYQKDLTQLSQKLQERETELANLRDNFKDLEGLAPEERNVALLDKYKSDLDKKAKEIKEKEEEIEDLEDEVSAIKKKLTKAKSEAEETKELLEKATRKLKETEVELQEVSLERDELKQENAIKAEAIEFVNAVLTAKEADDKDAALIDNKLRQIGTIIFDQYIPLLKLNPWYKEWPDKDTWIDVVSSTVAYWGNLQRKSWLNGKKVVAFIGEFSAGKTSIVNRILSQDDPDCPTLPVSSKATTAIATYISYGAGFLSQFTNPRGDLKNLSKEMFLKVNKDVLNRINASSLIQYFVMKYNNANLKGLSILDTPGFSSNDAEDQGRTLDVIREADALFWVMDANTGDINKSSLKVIADNIQELPLYIIINKADTKSPGELDKLEVHIQQTMKRANIDVKGYVRFSQESKLDELMGIIQSLKSKEVNNDIMDIFADIQSDINHLEDQLKTLRKNIRELETYVGELETDISSALDDLNESSNYVASIPKYNSRWFHQDDYRMDQDEYQRLTEYCGNISACSESVADLVKELKESVELLPALKDEQSERKELTNSLNSILNQLLNAIQCFNPELHKELIHVIRNVKKTKSCLEVQEEYSQEVASTVYNSSNTSDGATEFEKACSFSDPRCEEAKFWYIRSAKLGYQEARNYCQQMGYKY